MTDDDENLLAAYDLSVWEAPPPSPGLADAVVARARQPASSTPLETIERMNPRSGRRRWWIAGAMAAVAAIAILVGVWGVQRTPKDGQGEVTAQAAQTLAIGPTTAALDPGTFVTWRRDKRRITVSQPRGSAMWNVADGDSLVIDAGAMVASVEASGASLRVEVEMIKASDARAIGISAATAVAVALVTIVVYEGAVRVRHEGEVVTVAPGSRYEVRSSPVEPDPDPTLVGAKPSPDPRIKELEDRIKELEAERDRTTTATCDEVSCVLTNYDGVCCAKFKAQTPPTDAIPDFLDRTLISAGINTVSTTILACDPEGFTGVAKVSVKVAPSGAVTSAKTSSTANLPAPLVTCIESSMRTAKFPRTVNGGSFAYPFSYKATGAPPMPTCDADVLRKKADDHLATGMDAAALAGFEASMKCKPDPTLYRRMLLAACRSKNQRKAQQYFDKLPGADQGSLMQMCIRNGVSIGSQCDADALRQKGDDALQLGTDDAALKWFEMSMTCKPDPQLNRRIFLAACRAKNAAKAKAYFPKIASKDQTALSQLCIRNGIDPTSSAPAPAKATCQQPDAYDPMSDVPVCTGTGVIKINSKPAAKVLLDGKDTGKTTPMTLDAVAGRRMVTFQIGENKYTFAVTVKQGETTTLSKVFE